MKTMACSTGSVWLSGVLLATVALVGCSKDGDGATVITADDGSATLTIPKGALPDGVSADDILIVRDDSSVTSEDGEVSVWTLSPDGLTFLSPVALDLDTNIAFGTVFSVNHISEDATESLEPDFDDSVTDNGTIERLRVSIDHFSSVGVFFSGQTATMEWAQPATDIDVGGVTSPSFRVTRPSAYEEQYVTISSGQPRFNTLSFTDSWILSGTWRASPNLDPTEGSSGPTPSTLNNETESLDFRCVSAGDFAISTQATVVLLLTGTTQDADGDQVGSSWESKSSAYVDLSTLAECKSARDKKAEFLAEEAILGSDRIESLAVPGSASVNLADHNGTYGYYIQLEPGQVITVSVTGGGVGLNYFPEYSPGYDFVDGAPGTTVITNIDSENSNGVLLVIDGSAMVDVTVTDGG